MDGSSGRSYVTEQWHNVPLLRTRGIEYAVENDKILTINTEISKLTKSVLMFLKINVQTMCDWDFWISDLVKNPEGTDI